MYIIVEFFIYKKLRFDKGFIFYYEFLNFYMYVYVVYMYTFFFFVIFDLFFYTMD